MPAVKRLLAIEDNDHKWDRVEPVLRSAIGPEAEIIRAVDQLEGEKRVDEGGWDLILLDMSLDIRRTSGRAGQGGHDFTGGLKVAGRMYYLKKEAPTIIVTGFDAFPSGRSGQNQDVILGLEDIEGQASRYLGPYLIAIVRYGPSGWDETLASEIGKFIAT